MVANALRLEARRLGFLLSISRDDRDRSETWIAYATSEATSVGRILARGDTEENAAMAAIDALREIDSAGAWPIEIRRRSETCS